eukprot:gene5937-6876_t
MISKLSFFVLFGSFCVVILPVVIGYLKGSGVNMPNSHWINWLHDNLSPLNGSQMDSKTLWKRLYKERKMIVTDGGFEEFYHLISTLMAFPLEFTRKAMMSMMMVECCHNHMLHVLQDATNVPSGRPLIQFYLFHWQNFLYSIKRVNIVFRYFHRDWISKQADEVLTRPLHLHVRGSSWWRKLLAGDESDLNVSVVHLTIMMARGWTSVLFSGLQAGGINEVDQASKVMFESRLTDSVAMCDRDQDYSLVYAFLMSILHLQEYLVFYGDETPTFHPSYVHTALGNQRTMDNHTHTEPLFSASPSRCPFCNIFNTSPPVLCDEQMNRVAKKCYSFLQPTGFTVPSTSPSS